MTARPPAPVRPAWIGPVLVFGFVLAIQLWLVRGAGTDVPFHDQWNIEGQWLYPMLQDGRFRALDVFHPFNENRIAWTLALDAGLFTANGHRWDPLVEITVAAFLRAGCALLLTGLLRRGLSARMGAVVAGGVAIAFLPFAAWHNALWGIESHAYFVLGFTVATFALLAPSERSPVRTAAGLMAGVSALVAMSPGALMPPVLLGLAAVRALERRALDRRVACDLWPGLLLLGIAWLLRVRVEQHEVLRAAGSVEFVRAAARALAWPHVGQPVAALVMNVPLAVAVVTRVWGRRTPFRGEDFVVLLGGWGVAVALAIAWARGGSEELVAGVPSRYADFLIVLPIANAWCVVMAARSAFAASRRWLRPVAAAWGLFLAVGWAGLSAEMLRNIIVPRMHDREAPVRLAVAFQRSGAPSVFADQPRLLVPSPNLPAVLSVLRDPRLHGALPPSFQPTEPMGPLSLGARRLLGR